MAKFIKSMPALSDSEVKSFLIELSKPSEVTEQEKNLIQEVRKMRKNIGSPIKL